MYESHSPATPAQNKQLENGQMHRLISSLKTPEMKSYIHFPLCKPSHDATHSHTLINTFGLWEEARQPAGNQHRNWANVQTAQTWISCPGTTPRYTAIKSHSYRHNAKSTLKRPTISNSTQCIERRIMGMKMNYLCMRT